MEGKDAEGLPFAFLKSVGFKVGGQAMGKVNFGERVPFQCLVPCKTRRVVVTLDFQAHYEEPSVDIPLSITTQGSGEFIFEATPLITVCCIHVHRY